MPDAKSDFDVLRDKVIRRSRLEDDLTSALTKDSID